MTAPQPGWYPNPDGSADLRYWDGQSWTEHLREAPSGVFAAEQSVSFPPVAPQQDTPVNETIQFTDSPPGEPGDPHETIQFPPAPPEPELSSTDTMVFPDPASDPAAPDVPIPPPPVVPPEPAAVAPPVAPPPPAAPPPPVAPPPPAPPYPADGYGQTGTDVPAGFPAVPAPAPSYYPAAATEPVMSSSSNGVSVAALVLGIIGAALSLICGLVFFLSVPLGIVAAILGFVGMNQANKQDPPGPKGMAVAGLVLGIIAVVVSVGWFLLFLVGGAASSTSGF